MPPKRKPENRGLPTRWTYQHGAYYYRVPAGFEDQWGGKKFFRLGSSLPEAYKTWGERVSAPDRIADIAQLLERYALQVVPTKAPKTRTDNQRAILRLRQVFGAMALADIEPHHIYKYVDKRRQKTPGADGKTRGGLTAAHREIEVLSHAFTKAVEWGLMKRHPFKDEVRLSGDLATKPRTRYVEDWEIVECLSLPSRRSKGSVLVIQAYIRLKLLTGLARSDLLRLRVGEHVREDGIHVERHKTAGTTGKRTIYEFSGAPERREAVEWAKRVRPVLSPYLFCNRKGECYIDEATGESHGWDSMWQRFMDRVMAETKITARFTEHDLRAKVASDAESLERARALLQHADSATTQRVYRRRPERV